MATIKSYTDLSQSETLSKILPLESADMNWHELPSIGFFARAFPYKHDNGATEGILPCWSLASLLGVLPDYTLQTNTDGTVFVVCESKKPMISDAYGNPVDACYELILKLNELNLL